MASVDLTRRVLLALGVVLPACRPDTQGSPGQSAPSLSTNPPTSASAVALASAGPPPGSVSAPSPGAAAPPTPAVRRWGGLGGEIEALVGESMGKREFQGAVVLVHHQGEVVYEGAFGYRSVQPGVEAMTTDTIFDLASLTKPIATATLVHWLAARRELDLKQRLRAYFSELRGPLGEATAEHLLLHTSGLEADLPGGPYREGMTSLLRELAERPLEAAPGERSRYSDVGYQLLGELAARAAKKPLATLFTEVIAGPLGAETLAFSVPEALRGRAAPTEQRAGRWLRGEAHDPRVGPLGGAAGHAGLFGAAADLAIFAGMLLSRGMHQGKRVLDEGVVEGLLSHRKVPSGVRTLGWDVSSGMLTSRGDVFPPRGVGHLGFTGTALWIDPPSRTAVVTLTSRLHPEGKGNANRLRRGASTAAGRRALAPVLRGVDGAEALLRGQKIGLITHAAAVDVAGRRSVDALKAGGVEIAALFSPEHGLASAAEGLQGDGRDAATGLPIFSLYGERKRPSPGQLAGLDALVIDLQDAGCRFYTYLSTAGYALEEAARAGLPVVVLDRPNPLGGERHEGPTLDPGRSSFVGYHSVPVRHGMTLGELARMIVSERSLTTRLTVVAMEGWKRSMHWGATGFAWKNPSPNLRTPAAALLYPGVGMLEMTNLSVGRGTERPFEQLGAPWLDAAGVAREVGVIPGVKVATTAFTPSAGPHAKKRCEGLFFSIYDTGMFESLRLGAALASALRRLHRASWEHERLDILLGHKASLEAISSGEGAEKLWRRWQAEQGAFAERRRPFLMYE